jgi:hypothetical protein
MFGFITRPFNGLVVIHAIAKWHREIYPDVYEICGIVRYRDWLVMFKKQSPLR